MDSLELERIISDGIEAKRILGSPLTQAFLAVYRGEQFHKFTTSDDPKVWEDVNRKMQVAQEFMERFERFISDGNFARSEIEASSKRPATVSNMIR